MSVDSTPVLLNRGLDLVTPPLMAEKGALIDCLNYEMTSNIGYRRIDGYERYDGWIDGGISSYLAVTLEAETPSDQDKLEPRSLIGEIDPLTGAANYFASIVGVDGVDIGLYVPFKRTRLVRDGERLYITTPSGTSYYFFARGNSISGKDIANDAVQYTQNLRDFSAALRSSTELMPSNVAGVHFGTDRLYAVLDATVVDVTSSTPPPVGSTVRWNGYTYTVLSEVEQGTGQYTINLEPVAPATPVSQNMELVDSGGTVISTVGVGAVSTIPAVDGYLVYLNNPDVADVRGRVSIPRGYMADFSGGKWADKNGPTTGTDFYVVDGGDVLKVQLDGWSQGPDGGWTTDDATGRVTARIVGVVSGDRAYLLTGDNIYVEQAGTTLVMTLGDVSLARLAGTGALYSAGTRYQWGTYNFYAAAGTQQVYGVNGVLRAFWCKPDSWNNIVTNPDAAADNPKYLSMHARLSLALGYARGSTILSVPGQPTNYQGALGAAEFAVGDNITGLLEATGDTTIVFGKRSISRIVGTSTADYAQKTLVPNAGALDYTAVNVGGMPVFTDPYGVSTLQQSSDYGDFVGEKVTYPISDWLVPKLVPGTSTIETGGVVCAFPVREKMQYRLFLTSGEVVSVCFTSEGPKTMLSNYANKSTDVSNIRVPLAWSSQVADSGKEMIHVVWDYLASLGSDGTADEPSNPRRIHRLDYGWGFDGKHMRHYFDLAHTFFANGAVNTTIGQLRFYGKSYGVATMNLKSSSIEDDFDMSFNSYQQDMSLPAKQEYFYDNMSNVTNINDHANWGIGTKFRMDSTIPENSVLTEPPHMVQLMVMYINTTGASDG